MVGGVDVGSLFNFLGFFFGASCTFASCSFGSLFLLEAALDDFLATSFSRTTPPAEPARPAVDASVVAALRDRACFDDVAGVGFAAGDCGFVDIVKFWAFTQVEVSNCRVVGRSGML